MANYITDIANQLGVPIWIFTIILAWIIIWKLLALWKSARNNHLTWFIVLAVVNTVGILEILYIYVFSKLMKPKKQVIKKKSSKKKKR